LFQDFRSRSDIPAIIIAQNGFDQDGGETVKAVVHAPVYHRRANIVFVAIRKALCACPPGGAYRFLKRLPIYCADINFKHHRTAANARPYRQFYTHFSLWRRTDRGIDAHA